MTAPQKLSPPPSVGWICWCRAWPDGKSSPRPVLIARVFHDLNGEIYVLAVYGTGQNTAPDLVRPHELLAEADVHGSSMGISDDTKFDFKSVLPFKWDHATFGAITGSSVRRGFVTGAWKEKAIELFKLHGPAPLPAPPAPRAPVVTVRQKRTIERPSNDPDPKTGT